MATVTNAQLAAELAAFLERSDPRERELRDWQSGSPNGGENMDGQYPITSFTGETYFYKSPARLVAEVDDATNGALAHANTAEAAKTAAELALEATESARDFTVLNKDAAEDFKIVAEAAAISAANYSANSLVYSNASQAAQTASELAEAAAVSAKDEALVSEGVATQKASEASTSADEAAASAALAATFDPNDFFTKTVADGRFAPISHTHSITQVTGLQSALDGKQVAGSYAADVHNHVIADVTGLQGALDGKQAAGSYASSSHTHLIADVTGLQSALDGKQASGSYLQTTGGSLTGDLTSTGDISCVDLRTARTATSGVVYFGTSGSRYLYNDGTDWLLTPGALNVAGNVTSQGNSVLTTANYNSYSLPLSGGTVTNSVTFSTQYTGIARAAHNAGHLIGGYNNIGANSTKSNPIYTIGGAYQPTDDTLGNMYGVGYSHTNASFITGDLNFATGWGMYLTSNGTARIFMSSDNGNIATVGNFYQEGNLVLSAGNYSSYAVPKSGGSFTGSISAPKILTNQAQSRDKISVWNSGPYNIGMGQGYTFGGLNDYAMTFQMSDTAARGWWWGDAEHTNAQGAMSLTTGGDMTVANSVRVGYGESDTSASPSAYDLMVAGTAFIGSQITWNGGNTLKPSGPYMLHTSAYGWMGMGPANTLFCHITTDRPSFYMSTGLSVNGTMLRYGKGAVAYHKSSSHASHEVTISTAAPSGGASGDVWYKV